MIIFIDGPNGVGKDYTIERIQRLCVKKRLVFNTISFKDVIEDPVLRTSLRERQENNVSTNELLTLFDTHLKYIDMVKKLEYRSDVLVVNRFCPSFYVYQYMYPETADKAVPLSMVTELVKYYIKSFHRYDVKYVNLIAEPSVLLKRLANRDNGVNAEKHIKLQKFYEVFNNTFSKFFDDVIFSRSEELNILSLLNLEY